jgi:hypothetical protein
LADRAVFIERWRGCSLVRFVDHIDLLLRISTR